MAAKMHVARRLLTSLRPHSTNILEHLKTRALVRVSGEDSPQFLQGLITNDINHLEHGPGCMFTMFLNVKGRVLYDGIVYRMEERGAFLVECDVGGVDSLCRHLKMYRVRKKVEIDSLADDYNVFALFNADNLEKVKSEKKDIGLPGIIVPCDLLKATLPDSGSMKAYRDLSIFRDPRIAYLGSRIIASKTTDVSAQIGEIINLNNTSEQSYKQFRYYLGVGEGITDLPPTDCFPLEANCDYLHGVSFHKGCYIGQELTARTYHTGVVRKRLMPLYFSKVPTKMPEGNSVIHKGINLGKLRGIEGNVGLGLLRIDKALECGEFEVGNGIATTVRPNWWPLEAPKERATLAKG